MLSSATITINLILILLSQDPVGVLYIPLHHLCWQLSLSTHGLLPSLPPLVNWKWYDENELATAFLLILFVVPCWKLFLSVDWLFSSEIMVGAVLVINIPSFTLCLEGHVPSWFPHSTSTFRNVLLVIQSDKVLGLCIHSWCCLLLYGTGCCTSVCHFSCLIYLALLLPLCMCSLACLFVWVWVLCMVYHC